MLECLQEQLMAHPPIGLQEDSGPINSPSLEIRIHLLPCDYEYWRDGLPCSINKADESHMAPSFTSNLGGNRSSTLANNLHWLHHSGQATLIQVVDSIGSEIVQSNSISISVEENFNVRAVKGHCSGN